MNVLTMIDIFVQIKTTQLAIATIKLPMLYSISAQEVGVSLQVPLCETCETALPSSDVRSSYENSTIPVLSTQFFLDLIWHIGFHCPVTRIHDCTVSPTP